MSKINLKDYEDDESGFNNVEKRQSSKPGGSGLPRLQKVRKALSKNLKDARKLGRLKKKVRNMTINERAVLQARGELEAELKKA